MKTASLSTSPAVDAFRALHASGCFVLPNPWDVGSAVYLAHLGFKALATSSAGLAFTRGLPDASSALSRDETLAHIREIVTATRLPVNADFQSGFADDAEGVAESVRLCVGTGVAGLSIEDASGDPAAPLYERARAVERVAAARRAVDATGVPVVLTARCEAWLVGQRDPAHVAVDRLVAFAAAGADCLYAPGVRDPAIIATIVKAVAPKPVNVLVGAPSPELTRARLEDLGVRRISVGSALARVAWGGFMRAATSIAETGTFEGLAGAASFSELNALFAKLERAD
jgi:2-methylisocitrate lyase-like PEP mutase family enzyme